MHEPIWEGMEGYLAGKPDASFSRHLESCADCRDVVAAMEGQALVIRSLKAPTDLEPAPGFYARVMDRRVRPDCRILREQQVAALLMAPEPRALISRFPEP